MKNNTLPLIVSRAMPLLPEVQMKIIFARQSAIKQLNKIIEDKSEFIIVKQKDINIDKPQYKDLEEIGTIAKIKKHSYNEKTKELLIELIGIKAVKIEINQTDLNKSVGDYIEFSEIKQDLDLNSENIEDIINDLQFAIENKKDKFPTQFKKAINTEFNNKKNYQKIVHNFLYGIGADQIEIMQSALNTHVLSQKIKFIREILFKNNVDKDISTNIDNTINKKMNDNLGKQQKEFYLRERLRIIKEELGDINSREDESEIIRKKLEQYPYPQHIREKILSELNKYETALNSNESMIIKSYMDWLINLPWWQESKDNNDLKNVKKVLDKNHYGIDKVKERIIEYLAVKMQNPKARGPIICLVGPPGVGKTSLVKSISEALGKVFIKVSLGGVRDESELRGHRRTYLGAMPGRIIKGMKKAGVINPLFLLDEIDKMGSDHRGDPASAMLEILDPEQNSRFSDNYIEEEYDLSKVMFVATANYYNQIPYALIDRLEVIELSSYTSIEKREIAKSHLINRVLNESNLTSQNIKFTDEGIDYIINYYTQEAGVRELERMIQTIVRKYLVELLTKKDSNKEVIITPKEVEHYLGKKKHDINIKDATAIPGIVNGMAYTSAGGDLLPIEATYFKGKGNIVITGNLEQTMNESVNVALGYVKANAERFGINPNIFADIDIHVHVPNGGIPKDGPSAGVTLTTALISSLTHIPVSTNISMTGEIMLRGKVGIIGGVKEKTISAYRAGVREIFIPIDDERFLEDVPKYILKDIKVHLVKKYDEIYDELFKNKTPIIFDETNTPLHIKTKKK